MVVLDADSVMTGECLSSLVRLMEAGECGIIPVFPAPRLGHEHAVCALPAVCHPGVRSLFTAGLHFWQLGESHYWGHSMHYPREAVREHCALAPLPGRATLPGRSVARLRRSRADAPCRLGVDCLMPGSYEELPPNLLDELKRDRRWCQGNLMNRLF